MPRTDAAAALVCVYPPWTCCCSSCCIPALIWVAPDCKSRRHFDSCCCCKYPLIIFACLVILCRILMSSFRQASRISRKHQKAQCKTGRRIGSWIKRWMQTDQEILTSGLARRRAFTEKNGFSVCGCCRRLWKFYPTRRRLKAARELNGEVLSSRPSTDLYFVLFALRGTAGSVAAPFKFSNSHKCQCRTMMLMASSTRAAEEYGSSPKKTESRRQLGTNRALLTNVGLL